MKSTLSSVELSFYFCIWIFANIYSLHRLFESQSDIFEKRPELRYFLPDLKYGWSFIPRLKDFSDIEWATWKYLMYISWFYLLTSFVISELIRRYQPKVLKYWRVLSSVIFVSLHMGFKQLLIITAQPVIFAAIIFLGGKKITVWMTSILILLCYNTVKFKNSFWYFLDHDDLYDEEVYLILYCVAWIELRCISFSLDYINKIEMLKEKSIKNTRIQESLLNMFAYVFYLPIMFTGPIILYEDFEKSYDVKPGHLLPKLKQFAVNVFLFLFYGLILELSFYFFYFFAMKEDMKIIKKLPTFALCGGGLFMGLQFHMKYVISYGITTGLARLENIQAPPIPRCIARIHVYSQMWRHFDVGLYKFLVKYIYKPSLSLMTTNFTLPETAYKLLGSLTAFGFIFLWHGTLWNIFVWSILNFLGITLEQLGKVISTTQKYKWMKDNVLRSEEMETRFIALLCTPLLILSAISNFYLFAGTEVGDFYFESFTQPTLKNSMVFLLFMYSCCQVSIALKDVPSRTDEKKLETKVL